MQKAISEIEQNFDKIIKISVSDPFDKAAEFGKISMRPVVIKNQPVFQAERYKNKQVFHLNIPLSEAKKYMTEVFVGYRQICVFLPGETVTYYQNASGRVKRSSVKNTLAKVPVGSNDRAKEYILKEGEDIPALVDLGVFTPDFRIIKSKYDKYKQINRFVEIIDDELKKYDKEEITVLDFGCGKSYLTFVLYYYLAVKRGKRVKIIGYDLKEDVVADCNTIAEKYGYDNLSFVVADVKKDMLYDQKIDMVVSLHACDTATDYALNYAIEKGVDYIFSVPCCQHEINLSITKGGDMDPLLKYGIIKERVAALLTDSIRALILEDKGYSVDVLEFVDLSHSPKNIMLRAVRRKLPTDKNESQIRMLMDKYGFSQTLFSLQYKK